MLRLRPPNFGEPRWQAARPKWSPSLLHLCRQAAGAITQSTREGLDCQSRPSSYGPPRPLQALDLTTALQRTDERHVIGIFEVAAYRQPPRNACHGRDVRSQEIREVHGGRLAFQVGIGGQDDLIHSPLAY